MNATVSLPDAWVAHLFTKLTVRYGRQFMARWDGVDERLVRADWAQQLGGFINRTDCLTYALDNLPIDKPPTAAQFRDLANSMPERGVLKLTHDRAAPIPARVAQQLERLKDPFTGDARYTGPKAWAYRLQDREAAGERLKSSQRRMWRDALGMALPAELQGELA